MIIKLSSTAQFVLSVLNEHVLNGDAYTTKEELFGLCRWKNKSIEKDSFAMAVNELLWHKWFHLEGQRLYLRRTWQHEEACAQRLVPYLKNNNSPYPKAVPNPLFCGDLQLSGQQREAVVMACNHKLSCILGGAGTGKSTMIRSLVSTFDCPSHAVVLCAPTGKAARNITIQTGLKAYTVHSALGITLDGDHTRFIQWEVIELLVVDEASMLTLSMLAGILKAVPYSCNVVLVGDPNQLLSVGSGNVIPDLLALGIPSYTLTTHHRQGDTLSALAHNVHHFSQCKTIKDLHFDDSFVLYPMGEADAKTALCRAGTIRYKAEENVQILSPYNKTSDLSVLKLNRVLQKSVNSNPPIPDTSFRNLDRVMVTENDWKKNVFNGNVGQLVIPDSGRYHVFKGTNGESAMWEGLPCQYSPLALAYAITVHKAQGSAYDTVLIPLCRQSPMLTRNWIYTAISRGKKKVILYGNPDVLNQAVQTPPKQRKSMLVAKARMNNLKQGA